MAGSNGTATADLFGDNGGGIVANDTLEAHANRIDEMARALILEVGKFRERLSSSATQAINGITATKAEAKAHPIKAVLTHFDTAHQRKFDAAATINGGKDSATIKRLIAQHGEDKLRALIDEFFDVEDEWLTKTGYTVGNLAGRIPGMIASARIPTKVVGVTARTADNGRQAAAGADMIRQRYAGR